MREEIVIIGGGVIGVCAAYALAKKGARVTLLEQDEIASGASYGNAGLVVPSHSVPLAAPGVLGQGLRWMLDPESPFYVKPRFDPPFFDWLVHFALACRRGPMLRAIPPLSQLLLASRHLFDELAREFEFAYQQKGALLVYRSRAGLRAGVEEAQMLGEYGVRAQVLDPDSLHALVPALAAQVVGGVHYLQDAHLDPWSFVTGLAKKAERLGVQLRTKTAVLGFETAQGKITALHTPQGDLYPGQVILAAGAWSPAVARGLRLGIPVQAGKGYSLTMPRPEVCPDLPLMFAEVRVVVTPYADRLRLAGTMELAGMDLSINSRRVAAIQRAARQYLSGLEEMREAEVWGGLRPCTPDGLPIIGRSRALHNLIVATGHAMLGLSLGPVTGELVAQLAGGEQPAIDLTPFRVERF